MMQAEAETFPSEPVNAEPMIERAPVVDRPPVSERAPVVERLPAAEPASVVERAPVVEPTPVVQSPAEPASIPASRPAPEPVRIDTRAVLESAGLQMVETRHSDVSTVLENAPVQQGRPRRERPRPAEEPLQQVETKS
jgi:ribonuclease E